MRRSISAPTIAGCWWRGRRSDGFRVVDAFSRIIRLGEGIAASGRLSEAAIERAVDALRICRDKIRNRGATRVRLIATEACRRAENGRDFLARVHAEIGIDLEVVDRETEAQLAATGCTPLIDPRASGVILFDIGGGSSEIVRLRGGEAGRRGPPLPDIHAWASLPVGVVTLAERHGGVTVGREIFEAMVAEVDAALERFAAGAGAHRRPSDASARHLRHGDDDCRRASRPARATTAAASTAAGCATARSPRWSSGCWPCPTTSASPIRASAPSAPISCSPAAPFSRRSAGVFPCTRLRVADRGLREGMLVKMMREDGVWGRRESEAG